MSLSPLRTMRDVLGGGGPDSAAVCVIDNGRIETEWSRHELAGRVQKLGAQLQQFGIGPGDAVSIAMGNTKDYIVAFLAATWIRAIAAPLNPGYKTDEFSFFMEDAKSKVLIVEEGIGNKFAEKAAEKLKIPVWFYGNGESRTASKNLLSPYVIVDPPIPTDVALYLHTSGTTSRPKLVPLSHHNLCTSMGNIRNTYQLDHTDRSYVVMPLFHVHGLVGALFSTLSSGGTVILPKAGKFSATVFWNDIVSCRATWYTAVPTIHQILLARADQDKESINSAQLRFIRSCSSPLAAPVLGRLEATFHAPVLEAYAMTEASHQMTSNPLPSMGPHKPGSVGRPMNVQLAILDDKDNVVSTPKVVGNVCIRGENVTKGYQNRPEANISDFSSGWFHTGDQGYLDVEGYLYLTGRTKEIINRGGEKIAPVEIDNVLLTHPDIQQAVAFAGPSEKYGQEVCCAVVFVQSKNLTAKQIQEHCASKLAKEKVPSRIFITDSIPKTATGKVQRRFVAAKFLQPSAKL
uniref:Peroxisomal-coenzyme A synthetase n=1 Tax=Mucochytrium quahogii TaxID=96639 RepID=A0A7S2RLY8_9STRA|mmetsp:Transcript_8919/g.14503  ORF Transcript_8919/g.14503 Transcript_8919/m.14503 type:complete len:518 (+) Transcript_8919:247-1800(+)